MKRQKSFKNLLSVIICLVLIAAMALTMTACGKDTANPSGDESTPTVTDTVKTVGEGATEFNLTVADKDGKETAFTVKTDKKTVGEALLDAKLIEGEEGPYGLYIKTVNGITADYDTDGTYWAFYVDGKYATTGVDTTEITAKANYALKIEK